MILARFLFRFFFKGYIFPFERLDAKLKDMNEGQKKMYSEQASEVLNNPVFQDVLRESIRKMYQKLAVSSKNTHEQFAYRTALIWLTREFENNFKQLSQMYSDYRPDTMDVKDIITK